MKELLEVDLNDKSQKKPHRGINTFFFGDNRNGKCGIGNEEQFALEP